MAMSTQARQEIIKKHQAQASDTGSAPVQIALLTEKSRP